MKRNYECMLLLDNREVRKGWDQAKDAANGLLSKHGAEIVSSKLWEERKLSYPINHQERGTYLLVYFNAETDCITPINRELLMTESVMRHVVLACEDIPEEAHAPEKEFDVSKIGEEPEPEPEAEEGEAKDGESDAPEAAATEGGESESKSETPETKPETKEES